MTLDLNRKGRQTVAHGKYQTLYRYLCDLPAQEWNASFEDIEKVLGFSLPPSARHYSAWWANEKPGGSHTHALAWTAAGWKTSDVNILSETLTLSREGAEPLRKDNRPQFILDDVLPVHHAEWPEGLSLRREDMYADRV